MDWPGGTLIQIFWVCLPMKAGKMSPLNRKLVGICSPAFTQTAGAFGCGGAATVFNIHELVIFSTGDAEVRALADA